MTGYRLSEIHFPCQVRFLDTTYCDSIIIVHPGARAILYEWGFPFLVFFFPHIFAFLQLDYTLRHQIGFYIFIYIVEYFEFALFEWSAGVALYAAGSLAGMEIAYEVFFEQVFADYFIID